MHETGLNITNNHLNFSEDKILLLKAALLQGNEALESWRNYSSSFNFDKIDPVCFKLFPLLYVSLKKHEKNSPLLKELKHIYNVTWYKNKLLFSRMLGAVAALDSAGIACMPLKGMALTLAYYNDFGLRPMNDFDLLVPEKKLKEVIDILLKTGYTPENNFRFSKKYPLINNSYTFFGEDGSELDLHWHILFEACSSKSDKILMQDSIPVKTNNRTVNVLNTENQLLQAVVHGLNHFSSSGFMWIADVVFLSREYGNRINWDKMVEVSEKLNLSLSLYSGFNFINSAINPVIPGWVLAKLNSVNVSADEKKELAIKIYRKGVWWKLRLLKHHHRRHKSNSKFPILPYYFVILLQHKWAVKKIWMVPLYSVYAGINRLIKSVKQSVAEAD